MPVAVQKKDEDKDENLSFIEGLKSKIEKRIELLQNKYSKKRHLHSLGRTFLIVVFILLLIGYEISSQRINNTLFK